MRFKDIDVTLIEKKLQNERAELTRPSLCKISWNEEKEEVKERLCPEGTGIRSGMRRKGRGIKAKVILVPLIYRRKKQGLVSSQAPGD